METLGHEWEKASRGTDGRIFPWGNDWLPMHANTAEYWQDTKGAIRNLFPKVVNYKTVPVGTFSPQSDSPFGCVDMSGNVWEWTRSLRGVDWRYPSFVYPYDPQDARREDLKAGEKALRVLRGRSWDIDKGFARCATRGRLSPNYYDFLFGFRVVLFMAEPFTI